MLCRYLRGWSFRLHQQRRCGHSVPVLHQQRVGIEFNTNGIRGKSIAVHEGVSLFCISATINLKLHSIPVRILVIQRQCYSVMYTPVRRKTELFEAGVILEEFSYSQVGVADMINTDTGTVSGFNVIGCDD